MSLAAIYRRLFAFVHAVVAHYRGHAQPVVVEYDFAALGLGGALVAAMAERMLELRWIGRQKHSRVVSISELGRQALAREFGLVIGLPEE